MANELRHKDVGASMTQAEWEAIGTHIFNSQATGDILYASSATQLSRLAIGATNKVLAVIGGVPTWQSTLAGLTLTSPVINGTVTTTGLTLPALTLGGTVTLNGQSFDAGASYLRINTTAVGDGLQIYSTQDGTVGPGIYMHLVNTTGAAENICSRFFGLGRDDAGNSSYYGNWEIRIESPVNTSEDGYQVWQNRLNNGWNDAMKLASGGGLSIDAEAGGAANHVLLFDEYDDALILREGISEGGLSKLAEIGVMSRKDSGSGWFLNVQPMSYLLAGGIYQTRARIDNLVDVLIGQFPELTDKLIERKLIGG